MACFLTLVFCVLLGVALYGAFLIVQDKQAAWEQRNGKR
jgi:hypothetical protein